jgi:hypothetical protein
MQPTRHITTVLNTLLCVLSFIRAFRDARRSGTRQ